MSLELQVGVLQGKLDLMIVDVAQIRSDVRSLLASEYRRKGGWTVLSIIGGLIGGLLSTALS